MKIKFIKDYRDKFMTKAIEVGTIVNARIIPPPFGMLGTTYQIIEGDFSGVCISKLYCIELDETTKSDEKLVVLPVKVAEAIEKLKRSGWKVEDLLNTIEFMDSSFKPTVEPDHPGYPIAKYLQKHNLTTYASALVNGYTVETLESKIKGAVLEVINTCSEENEGYIIVEHNTEIARRITEVVTQIIREDGAAG